MNKFVPSDLWDLDNRMTVVLFAGMGGGCDGLEAAGFHVHLAVNHDPLAIAVHETRHPHTTHLRCDVFEVDPRKATAGRGVRNLHASPDCTHFSVAKGSKPVSKRRRSLAWVIIRWAGTVRPEVITLENVREITTWGPLICKRDKATGRAMRLDGSVAAKGERIPIQEQWLIPDPRHKGRTWRQWLRELRELGYSFEHRNLCCADYGVPTIRKRLFGVARADGGEIRWPGRTHAPRSEAKALGLLPWVGAHTIIDWWRPVQSIFDRKKPLAEATLRRIARGVMRFVVNSADPFIVPITHSGGDRVHPITDPLRTFTTAHRGELALVVPTIVDTAHGEGQGRGVSEWPVTEPMRTVSASPGKAVVAAHLTHFRTGATGSDMRDPIPTYTANSFHKRPGGAPPLGVASVHLEKFSENSAGLDPREPLNTVMAGGQGHAVVAATLAAAGGRAAQMEPRDLLDPLNTTSTKEDRVLVAATLVQTGYGEREGQAPRSKDIEEPAGTQVAGGSKEALVAAFLAKHNTDVVGNDARDPLSTITTGGERGQTQIAPVIASLRGTSRDGHDARAPLPAQSAGGNHELLILPFLQTYYGSGDNNHDAREPLHTVTVNDRHGLVTVQVNGQTMVITDICMRMLHPLEGARAHEFDPASLQHEIEVVDKRGNKVRRKPNTTEIGHLVGNSVPPRMVQLLAESNCRRELMMVAAE